MSQADGYTFDAEFAHVLARESWALYGLGALFFVTRVFTKIQFLKRFDADDWVSVLAFGLYTGLLVTLNFIAQSGGSNLYDPGDEVHFTPKVIEDRIYNSKIVVVSEQFMLNVIYVLKCSVLLFYLRLTEGLPRQRVIRYVAISVAVAWVGTQICFFTACQPFSGYWAIPPPSAECTTLKIYGIVQAIFNIPTDLFMLCATVPVVYKLQVPLKQKVLIGGLFSLGIAVLIMAILAKAYNNSNYYSSGYMLWYIREASTATYVANLPHIWPLIRHIFPCLRNGTGKAYTTSNRYGGGATHTGAVTTIKSRARGDDDQILLNHIDLEAIQPGKILTTVEVRQEDEKAEESPHSSDSSTVQTPYV
ncbi:Translation factor GUF1, mitochondrial [Elsinoe australis]|uniref:Translation factor GUF1, mitochondrial n=1 Tax=Elsinoe australis TaxID=40998 RepID=A0A2P7ZE51_9PEZI|nr:Translation factor GUF1, mitochondrial [Elsinoe australis]